MSHRALDVSPEVAAAQADGAPVVALESTLISHGMPWPDNAECAHQVEAAVRAEGAVPATIAILGGRPTVGLDARQIEQLARAGERVRKCSRRDLPFVMAAGDDTWWTTSDFAYLHLLITAASFGALIVAASLLLANRKFSSRPPAA